MPDRLINWPLIANPANWLVIFLMLSIVSIGITVIHASWSNNMGG